MAFLLLHNYTDFIEYYKERTHGVRTENWSQQIETFLGRKTRLDMLDELKKAGFIQR